jgi:hypothetical protein
MGGEVRRRFAHEELIDPGPVSVRGIELRSVERVRRSGEATAAQ